MTSNSIPAVSTVSSTPSLGLSATSQSAASTKVALSTGDCFVNITQLVSLFTSNKLKNEELN